MAVGFSSSHWPELPPRLRTSMFTFVGVPGQLDRYEGWDAQALKVQLIFGLASASHLRYLYSPMRMKSFAARTRSTRKQKIHKDLAQYIKDEI